MAHQQRSFNLWWYDTYPFVEYSIQKDAIFCFACRLFPLSSHKAEEVFTVQGFRDWKKVRSKLEKHGTHKNSLALWTGYIQAKHHGTVGDVLNSERA